MRILVGSLVAVLVVALGVTGFRVLSARAAVDTMAPGAAVQASGGRVSVRDNQARLEFIRSFGWEVEEEPIEIIEVIIPQEFDAVYKEYNLMQQAQGYDLERYAGRRAKRFSYRVINYPGNPKEVRINLLVRDNRVIGGDVSSMDHTGFMHGFAKPQ